MGEQKEGRKYAKRGRAYAKTKNLSGAEIWAMTAKEIRERKKLERASDALVEATARLGRFP